jgi:hypothetical protein
MATARSMATDVDGDHDVDGEADTNSVRSIDVTVPPMTTSTTRDVDEPCPYVDAKLLRLRVLPLAR